MLSAQSHEEKDNSDTEDVRMEDCLRLSSGFMRWIWEYFKSRRSKHQKHETLFEPWTEEVSKSTELEKGGKDFYDHSP